MKMAFGYRVVLVQLCVLLFCAPLISCGNRADESLVSQSDVAIIETELETSNQETAKEEAKEYEVVVVPENLVCTNTLYQFPYFIFQGGLSSKPSDFYLTAYNVSTGAITCINQGYHRQYFIRDHELFFDQYESYYKCSMKSFQIQQVEEDEYNSKMFNDDERLQYAEDWKALPEAFKKLDHHYINQIIHGHFTSIHQEETFFLTGDGSHSSVGIVREKNNLFLPCILGELTFPENEIFPFWQSMVVDIDHDGLDEVIVVGHYYDYHKNPSTVFIWDFDVQNKTLVPFMVGDLTEVSDPELIEKHQKVYLQYTFEGIDYTLKIDVHEERDHPYVLVPSKEPLTGDVFAHQPAPYFPTFSFIEKFEQSSSITMHSTEASKAFPCVSLPPRLSLQQAVSSEKEQQFVSKQNKYLSDFLSLLEKGRDPFKQKPKYPCEGMKYLTEMVSVCQNSSLSFVDYIQGKIHRIDSLFPIVADGMEYVVIAAKGNNCDDYVFLFSPSFDLLAIDWGESSDTVESVEIIFSLSNPSYFWISTYAYRGPYLLRYLRVEDEKLICSYDYCFPGMIRKNGKVFFEYSDGFMYRETKGCDSGMYASVYVDPFTAETHNEEFLTEMLDQYDSLYTYCFCLRSRYATFDGVRILDDDTSRYGHPALLLSIDGTRQKYNEVYWPFLTLERFEREIKQLSSSAL